MNLADIVEINQRYMVLYTLLFYSLLFLYSTRKLVTDRISKAIVLAWGKILSFVYLLNFPLILYFYTFQKANFEKFMILIVSIYGITYVVLFATFQAFTLEMFAKIVYYLTGYDLSKKLKLKRIKF